MSFPWDNLITATSVLVAGIGGGAAGAWLRGRSDQRRDDRAAETAHMDRQREAYAALVTTARLALRNFRQLKLAYVAGTPDVPAVRDAFSQAASLSEDLNRVTVVAEMLGSAQARQCAKAIYDKAKACGDLYQAHELKLAGMRRGGSDSFDAGKADTLCGDLDQAVTAFIDVIRPELDPGRRS